MKRREFLAGSAIGAISICSQETAKASTGATPTLGETLDSWSEVMDRNFSSLSHDLKQALLREAGATDFDELKLTYAKRFPNMNAKDVITNNQKLLDLMRRTQIAGDYDKSNDHDKEAHDKSAGLRQRRF